MRVLLVLILLFPVFSEAGEVVLGGKGRVTTDGSETNNYDNLTVFIDADREHLRVDWGAATMINNEMYVQPNEYSYSKSFKNSKQLEVMFSINRTTLEYYWGVYITSADVWQSSVGNCSKIDPKI